MKKNIFLIVTFAIIVILLLILLISRKAFTVIEVDKNNILDEINTSGATLLYTKKVTPAIKKKMKAYYKDYRIQSYASEMNLSEINELLAEYDLSSPTDNVFILFMNGEVVEVVDATDDNKIIELIEKHLYNIIPESERAYQVLSTADQYIKKVNSKDYTVAVFGKKDCTYCDLYLLIVNKIAKEKNLNIYYFNRDEYDEDEYEKIMELDFEIPAKCNTTGYSTSMSKSFPKPMTIITKEGKFVDCIKGYVTEDNVLDMLKQYKIVKE